VKGLLFEEGTVDIADWVEVEIGYTLAVEGTGCRAVALKVVGRLVLSVEEVYTPAAHVVVDCCTAVGVPQQASRIDLGLHQNASVSLVVLPFRLLLRFHTQEKVRSIWHDLVMNFQNSSASSSSSRDSVGSLGCTYSGACTCLGFCGNVCQSWRLRP